MGVPSLVPYKFSCNVSLDRRFPPGRGSFPGFHVCPVCWNIHYVIVGSLSIAVYCWLSLEILEIQKCISLWRAVVQKYSVKYRNTAVYCWVSLARRRRQRLSKVNLGEQLLILIIMISKIMITMMPVLVMMMIMMMMMAPIADQ